jgi:hypothetical protein
VPKSDGVLIQKAAYKIADMFPNGPNFVTAALTNLKSGVTILISRRKVYRFRWNKQMKRFYVIKLTQIINSHFQQTRYSPVDLTANVTFEPKFAFQWKDGNIILSNVSNLPRFLS